MTTKSLCRARNALQEAIRAVAKSDATFWDVLEYGEPDEIEEALKPYKNVELNFLNKRLDDTFIVDDSIVEWDGKYATVLEKAKWLDRQDGLRDEYADKLAEEFQKEFARSPSKLYHATDSSNIESIMKEGLHPMSKTRGLTNRGVGPAIFTTLNVESADYGTYGDTVIEIDVPAMKKDGVRFVAEQEPAVFEREAAEALASEIDLDNYYWETGGDGADDPETVILFVREIPPEYLTVLEN